MSSLPPIKTVEDFHRISEELDKKTNELVAKSKKERWPSQRLIGEIATLRATHFSSITDPENPVAVLEGRRILLLLPPFDKMPTFKPEPTNPLLAMVKESTESLNKIFSKNWAPPGIILVEGLIKSQQSPAAFSKLGDVLLIDNSYAMNNMAAFKAIVAHEVVHRYQRSMANFLIDGKIEAADMLGAPQESQLLNQLRQREAEADFFAAVTVSPDVYKRDFSSFLVRPKVIFQYIHEKMAGKSQTESEERFTRLPPTVRSSLLQAYKSLASEDWNQLHDRMLRNENSNESQAPHPSDLHRLNLMDYLKTNPAMLTCKNVKFDGSANLVSAQECGPKKVTLPLPAKQTEALRK